MSLIAQNRHSGEHMVRSWPDGHYSPVVPVSIGDAPFPYQDKLLKDTKMNYEERDTYGIYKAPTNGGPGPELMGADTLNGNDVYNEKDEDLGDIKEIMLNMRTGKISYAVLSYGGFLSLGEKLFAVPWEALKLDTENKRFVLNVDKDRLESAPGFDKDDWPDMADSKWAEGVNSFYGVKPNSEGKRV